MSQGVLRFITAGSVDDGKSTLIGRLLYDTKAVLADQLLALSKTKHARVTAADAEVDLALLTDGLEAEREQGITIDVAYRYFATANRKFIVADAPGHEQYTRNLVTGASQADVAVILVDATRVDLTTNPPTLLAQTKRHSAIVKLLGLRHIVFAVNKMDLVGFDEAVFAKISGALLDLGKTLGLPTPQIIPVSALVGDNVVTAGKNSPWYKGPALLPYLESIDIQGGQEQATANSNIGFRMPVQLVARQDGSADNDFRGYLGQVESGSIKKGQSIIVLPSGQSAEVAEIHVANDHRALQETTGVQEAHAGQVVALSLTKDVDVSRGDMFVAANEVDTAPKLAKQIAADICWLDGDDLSLARKYILRHTTNNVFAKVKVIESVLDVQTLSHGTDSHALRMNDIGRLQLRRAFFLSLAATTHQGASGICVRSSMVSLALV